MEIVRMQMSRAVAKGFELGGVEGEIAEWCQSNFPTFLTMEQCFFINKIVQDYVLRCDHYIKPLFNGQLYNIRL